MKPWISQYFLFVEIILHTTITNHHSATALWMALIGFKFHYHEQEAEIIYKQQLYTSSYILTALQCVLWCTWWITQPPAPCKICPHFMQQEPMLRELHWSSSQVHLLFLAVVICYHSPPCHWQVPLCAENPSVCPGGSAYWWWCLQPSLISVMMVNSI